MDMDSCVSDEDSSNQIREIVKQEVIQVLESFVSFLKEGGAVVELTGLTFNLSDDTGSMLNKMQDFAKLKNIGQRPLTDSEYQEFCDLNGIENRRA